MSASGARWRGIVAWAAIAVAVLLVGLAVGPSAEGPPLDPRSTAGDGTKALVLLLRQLGTTVDVSDAVPGPDVQVTVVLRDELSTDRRDGLRQWVDAGGTLVVADPTSDLQLSAPVRVTTGVAPVSKVEGPCPAAGLSDVGQVDTGGSFLLELPSGAVGCFPGHVRRTARPDQADAFLLVTRRIGRGRFVRLGGAGLFTNARLGHSDNSVLAVDLLAPRPGTHLQVLLRSPLGGGRTSLSSLVGRRVKMLLLQLLVAFGVVALWRGRRLGRPVAEPQPVELAGSELVVAVGNLLQRTGRRDAAAAHLRAGLRQWLSRRLGLGPGSSPADLADAATARSPVDRADLLGAVEDRSVASDGDLVELAQLIERVRQEVAHGRS